jgi:hypothetical protein
MHVFVVHEYSNMEIRMARVMAHAVHQADARGNIQASTAPALASAVPPSLATLVIWHVAQRRTSCQLHPFRRQSDDLKAMKFDHASEASTCLLETTGTC